MKQPITLPPSVRFERGKVVLRAVTPGASIGYRLGDGPWQLYRGPIDARDQRLEAKAIRYGFSESSVVRLPR
jgi:hypothetical protein